MKSKTIAIVLAVMFGSWSWLYTYKQDGWKFWVSLIIPAVMILAFYLPALAGGDQRFINDFNTQLLFVGLLVIFHNILSIIAILVTTLATAGGQDAHSVYFLFVYLAIVSLWFWVVVDSMVKPKSFFTFENVKHQDILSIVFSVLFSYNTWILTFSRHSWKFWTALGISNLLPPITLIVLFMVEPKGHGSIYVIMAKYSVMCGAILAILWLWPFVDTLVSLIKSRVFKSKTPAFTTQQDTLIQ